ncbi:sulfatase [Gramella sp. AN32]|uniref:Sulfatase n=1 Tax=Christiangramia antarctica TaxID=2058158 RepID=A0ABW5X3H7_9FLAO|nr:sulfatase [Gramella sp. AN32]MCM4155780.1 hypothetical protein [Gramella sp. AN32]
MILRVCISLLVLLSLAQGECQHNTKPDSPNIVFILVDDLGYSDVGYMGYKKGLNTPNIDQLAKNGRIFAQAYAAAPVCSPTRASILTGKSPAELKLTCHIPGLPMAQYLERQHKGKSLKEAFFIDHLLLEEVTLAEALKSHGYKTGFFGKWHLSGSGSARSNSEGVINEKFQPQHQGFDVNIGGCAYGQPSSWFAPYNNATIPEKEEGEYLTDRMGDEAVNYITKSKNKPFFLYLSTYTVHTPLKAPQQVVKKNDGNTYHAMIEKLDQNVGKLMNHLKQNDLLENTMVVFYSDNGGLWGNPPLRGNKGSLHEGGVRVPLVISWPGKIEPGKSETPVTSIDLFPTIMEVVNNKSTIADHMEGISLLPELLHQKELKDRPLYWHFPHYRKEGQDMGAAIREGDWKLIQDFESDSIYLYNLKKDLGEVENLVEKHPQKAGELLEKLKSWQKKSNAEMPQKNKDFKSETPH